MPQVETDSMGIDQTTEEKIKATAKAIFMKKGYAATRTRDIAEEAGINLALLNYYFRSKEKLFQQIMMESLQGFFASILTIFNDSDTDLEEKLRRLASSYIEQLIGQPDIPMFILSELRSNPKEFMNKMPIHNKLKGSVLFAQLIQEIGEEKARTINPLQIMMNIMSMILFPFVARPMLEDVAQLTSEDFKSMMEERKKLIPMWIMDMIKS